MTRLFSALVCLLLLMPAYAASSMVVSSVDWGGGMRSQGTMKASGLLSPRDVASGLPTGKRQHKPLSLSEPPSGRPTGQRQHKLAAPKDPASGLPTKSHIVSPRDAASGLPTGKRQHKPIVITKPVDKASPMLMKAHQERKVLPRVVLRGRDASSSYLMWELKNVRITSYSVSGATDGPAPMETFSLNFEEIKMTY